MKKVSKIWLTVFVFWSAYRFFFHFPEWVDELLIKPLIFILLPLKITKAKKIPGFESKKHVFEDILIGVVIGFVFAFVSLIVNKLKHGVFSFSPILPLFGTGIFLYLGLSLATSFSEEILGRGFVFGWLKKFHGVFLAAVVSSFFSLSLHLPILLVKLHLTGVTLATFLTSVFLLSMVNSYLYHNRGNLVLPILIHAFWNMSVALYL